ncbi:MAG TPA: bifunctional DNA-formamidopyrimidine glycosylase/DNA-(apurinic or apyrimidinic site) lyase [Anaerolineales bacterium]|nr:bifunctional DNA-formamidopyrimidine glycosylase/DNA-(apurinic or apyrimidinic site) lyase [Anaerolineales bacterium]HRF50569.1 bifunctional DNA-formamidopyrimidine glycosylase/DNA-(apurinic or apyrimidinic site) lyase [Anaerolineales bacterium]
MPELPEVETVARELREGSAARGPSVLGRTIARVTVRWPRQIVEPTPREIEPRLHGQQVLTVGRRGKVIVFTLTRDVLLVHLRMSGDLTVVAGDAPPDKHAHTVFHFADGAELRFSDTRKFGKIWVVPDVNAVLAGLGPEPIDDDFTSAVLAERLRAHRRALKPLLLDQSFVAGVGNIYADEALHLAGLHPLRRSDTLTPPEVRGLWKALRQALNDGLRHNGASIDWQYRGGGYQEVLRAYGRAGRACQRPGCTGHIRRIVVGQRSTHFCPVCQRRTGAGKDWVAVAARRSQRMEPSA